MPYKDYEKQKENARQRYYKYRDEIRRQVTEYYYKNHERRKEQKKLWAEKNKEKLIEYRKYYAKKYKKRKKLEETARMKLHCAIKSGRIIRQNKCSKCDKDGLIHAHHPDYNKPLEVEWLCHQCHFAKHRKYKNE